MARIDDRYLIQMVGDSWVVVVDSDTMTEVVLDLTGASIIDTLTRLGEPVENYPDTRRVVGRESISDNSPTSTIFISESASSSLAFWLGYFYSRSSE